MSKQELEARISQLESDVRQLRMYLKPKPETEAVESEPIKRKPGRPPNAKRENATSSD